MKNMEEMVKKIEINTKFIKEEIVIDVKYVEKDTESMIVIDSGAPVSLVSSTWLENYLKEAKVDDEEVERSGSNRRFRLGKTLYISVEKVKFPVMMKTDGDDLVKWEVTADVIESDEVTFLCGEETLMNWRTTLDFRERKLGFKEIKKEVQLIKESHMLVKLELVGRWRDEDAVFLIKKRRTCRL